MGSLDPVSQYSHDHDTPNSSLKHDANLANMPSSLLVPTWTGYVADTADALILFQGAIDGSLRKVVRRPHDRERAEVIRSGAVFIYEESASGIKRWTDGVPWSPSRILGNFLIYRELAKPFPPGEKKRATKKTKSPRIAPYPQRSTSQQDDSSGPDTSNLNGSGELEDTSSAPGRATQTQISATSPPSGRTSPPGKDSERSLVGSLTDSYAFKQDGLVKKTLSINYHGGHLHLVSYYNPDEVRGNLLMTIPDDPHLSGIQIPPDLIRLQTFRTPVEGINTSPSVATPTTSFRPSLQGQYLSSTSASYVNNQQYHISQQTVPHTSGSYYSNMSTAPHVGYQLQPSYPSTATAYAHYNNRSLPASSSGSAISVGHYQTLPSSSQLPLHPIQQDQSSYMQQSSYQLQDGRHNADHFQFKEEWQPDGVPR